MKVKDLIRTLQDFNPEADVQVSTPDQHNPYQEIVEILYAEAYGGSVEESLVQIEVS